MERSATAFTAADRIGQLAVQIERHRRHAADARDAARRCGSRRSAAVDPLELGHVTLWAGRVGDGARPRGVGVPARRRRRAAAVRPRRARCCTRGGSRRPGCSRRPSCAEVEERLAAITARRPRGRRRGRPLGDRAAARRRRPEDPRRPLAQRPGRDRVPALRRRRVRRGRARRCARFARAILDRAARGGRDADARLHAPAARDPGHASATTCSPGSRCSSATGRASRSPATQAAPSPLGAGALAGSTLPLPPPPNPMRNSIDAVADRDFALDYLYAAAVLFTHLSRIGEELVLWTTTRVRLRAPARGRRDRVVDDAAEAERRRRRARARQGRHRDRPADRACSRR